MSDLSLVPTNELVDALKARFDHLIFSGVQVHGAEFEHDGERANAHLEAWHGHVTMCAGMATDLIRTMQDWAREDRDDADEPTDGGD